MKDLGFYNPHTKVTSLNKDEAVDWMKKGAQPSNTVAKLMATEKIKHSSVVVVKKKKKSKQELKTEKPAAQAAPVAEVSEAEVLDSAEETSPEGATETQAEMAGEPAAEPAVETTEEPSEQPAS